MFFAHNFFTLLFLWLNLLFQIPLLKPLVTKTYTYKQYTFHKRCLHDLSTESKNTIVQVFKDLRIKPTKVKVMLDNKGFAAANSTFGFLYLNPQKFNRTQGKRFIIGHECIHLKKNDSGLSPLNYIRNCLCLITLPIFPLSKKIWLYIDKKTEKRADIKAAQKLKCADQAVAWFDQEIWDNQLYYNFFKWTGLNDVTPHGNNPHDTSHPSLTERRRYMHKLATKST